MFSEYTITIHKADPPPKKRHGSATSIHAVAGGRGYVSGALPPEEAEKVMHSLVASAHSWCKNRGCRTNSSAAHSRRCGRI